MHRVSPSSPEEIHALIAAALNAGDLDAFVALHEEGATTLVPPDGQPVSGREAIRAALAPMFALRPSARIEVVGKLEADGLALTHARLNVVAGAGADGLEVSGHGTIVSRRQPDGSWRIVLDNPMTPA
ncbi:MAG TPA: SgcJ/EcaC family oxidoreductase [Solirubrobacteraceae bacterium]|nr:SgcJ/EcaC family oxidoreductase [Solirubrobacteraceae bacterium]